MATFRIDTPDGRTFEVEAPSGTPQQELISAVQDQMASAESEIPDFLRTGQREAGLLENIGSGLGAGFTGMFESAALGGAAMFDEETELKLRDYIQSAGAAVKPSGGNPEDISYQLANAVGSMGAGLTAIPLGMAGGAPAALAGAGALFMGAGAGEASERAREAGATEAERGEATLKGAAIGALDIAPYGRITKFLKIPLVTDMMEKLGGETVKGIGSRIRSAATTGGFEAAQETASELLQNLNQQGYDPTQTLGEGLGQSAGMGFGAGAIVQTLVDVFTPGKNRGGKKTSEDAEVDKILGLSYDPHEQITLPDGSTMDVRKDDPNRLRALKLQGELAGKQPPADAQLEAIRRVQAQEGQQAELESAVSPEMQQVEDARAEARLGNEPQRDAFPAELESALDQATKPTPPAVGQLPEEERDRKRAIAEQHMARGEVGKALTVIAGDVEAYRSIIQRTKAPTEAPVEDAPPTPTQLTLAEGERSADFAAIQELNSRGAQTRQMGEESMVFREAAAEDAQARQTRVQQEAVDRETALTEVQARLAETQDRKTTAARIKVLSQVLENDTESDQRVVESKYSNALSAAGFANAKITPRDRSTIAAVLGQRTKEAEATAADIARRAAIVSPDQQAAAEQAKTDAPALAAAAQAQEAAYAGGPSVESAIPEQVEKPPATMFPGITPVTPDTTQRRTEDVAQEQPKALVNDGTLARMGVLKTAPIRKAGTEQSLIGRDTNNPADLAVVREQLEAYGNNPSISKTAKRREEIKKNIAKFLQATQDTQIPMLGPRGGVTPEAKATGKRAKADGQPRETGPAATGAGVSDTGQGDGRGAAGAESPGATGAGLSGDGGLEAVGPVPAYTEDRAAAESAPLAKAKEVANTAQEAYKADPTPENKAASDTALQALGVAVQEESKRRTASNKRKKTPGAKTPAKKPTSVIPTPAKPIVAKPVKGETSKFAATLGKRPLEFVTKDPVTANDTTKIQTLVNSPKRARAVSKEHEGAYRRGEAARTYFGKYDRPQDAIAAAVHDMVFENPQYRRGESTPDVEAKFFKGTKAETAAATLEWVDQNLSGGIRPFVEQQIALNQRGVKSLSKRADKKAKDPVAEQRKQEKKQQGDIDRIYTKLQQLEETPRTELGDEALDALYEKVDEAKSKGDTKAIEVLNKQAKRLYDVQGADKAFGKRDKILREILKDLGELNLAPDAVSSLDVPLHPGVVTALKKGDLKGALESLKRVGSSPEVKQLAGKLASMIGTTKVKIVKNLKNESGDPIAGTFDPKTNTVKLDSEFANSTHVLMHESMHAVTSHTLANKSHTLTKKLTRLYEELKGQLDSVYGAQSLDEFVAEAFSNPMFQVKLASLFGAKKENSPAWRQFLDAIVNFARNLVGRPNVASTSYDQFNEMVEGLMGTAPETRFAGELQMAVLAGKGAQFLENAGKAYAEKTSKLNDDHPSVVAWLDRAAKFLLSAAPDNMRRAFLGFLPSQAMSDIFIHEGFPREIMNLHRLFEQQHGDLSHVDARLDAVQNTLSDWLKANPDKKKLFDQITIESTLAQIDPSRGKARYRDLADAEGATEFDAARLADFDRIDAMWKKLGPEGQKHYKELRDAYKALYTNLKEQIMERVESVSKDDAVVERVRSEIFNQIFDENLIEPYFPLTRRGDLWLAFNVAPKNGQAERIKMAFELPAARDRYIATLKDIDGIELDKSGNPVYDNYTGVEQVSMKRAPPTSFVSDVISTIRANAEKDSQGKITKETEETIEQITRLFIQSMPESSYARSLQRREGVKGFNEDAVLGFRDRAYDLGRQATQVKYAARIRKQYDQIVEQIESKKELKEHPAKSIVLDELAARVKFAIEPSNTMMDRTGRQLNRMAFMGTIGFNPSSALVNLTQVPMVVFPFLAGKTDVKTATGALMAATKIFKGAGHSHKVLLYGSKDATHEVNSWANSIDNFFEADTKGNLHLRDDIEINDDSMFYKGWKEGGFTKKEFLRELKPFVEAISDRGLLSRSFFYDSLGAQISGKEKHIGDYLSAWGAFPFHTAERMNRQVTLVASYLNEMMRLKNNPIEKQGEVGLTHEEQRKLAMETAMYDAQQTNGGAVLDTTSRWAQHGLGRVAMMYKVFGIQMYYTQAKLFAKAIGQEKDPELRRIAKRQFMMIQGSVLALSGISGLTAYGMMTSLWDMLFTGDDEVKVDDKIRMLTGEGLYKGGANMLTQIFGGEGVDISSRVGLSHLLLGSNRYNFNPSLEKTIVTSLGGPAYGYGSQIARGFQDIGRGEYQRGVENILPAAFRNVAKAVRYTDEGANTRRGDPIAGDIGAGLIMAQALGFAPAEYTLNQEKNQLLKGIDRAVNEQRTLLTRNLYIAMRNGDNAEMADIYRDIAKFNKKHPQFMLSPKAVMKSLKQHMVTSSKMHNGVLFSPKMRSTLEMISDDFDNGFVPFM